MTQSGLHAMQLGLAAYAFILGACVGSFLNVVIARVPAHRSIISPRSACPRCGTPIRWQDNIPVLSWILLRARCRSCQLPISARYPFVELLMGALGLALFRQQGLTLAFGGSLCFSAALVALAYIDLDTWLLPNEITWPLIAVGLSSPLWNHQLSFLDAAVGAAAGWAVLAVVRAAGAKAFGREAMGLGDLWLLAAIGAWLGWRSLLPVVMLSALQGAVIGSLLLLRRRGSPAAPGADASLPSPAPTPQDVAAAQPQDLAAGSPAEPPPPAADDWTPDPSAVPFGPFLALAALEQLLLGDVLLDAYFSFIGRLLR